MKPWQLVFAHISPLSVASDSLVVATPSLTGVSFDRSVYVGVTLLLFMPLVLCKIVRRKFQIVTFFVILWIISCCFVMNTWEFAEGWSFYRLHTYLPLIRNFHHIYRVSFIGNFALVMLGTIALHLYLLKKESKNSNDILMRFTPLIVWGVVIIFAVFSTLMQLGLHKFILSEFWHQLNYFSGGYFAYYTSILSPTVLFSTAIVIILLLFQQGLVKKNSLIFILTLITSVDLLIYGIPQKPTEPNKNILAPPPLVQAGITEGSRVLSYTPLYFIKDSSFTPSQVRRGFDQNLPLFDNLEDCGGFITTRLPKLFYDFYDYIGAWVPHRVTKMAPWKTRGQNMLQTILPLLRACSIEYIIIDRELSIPGLSLLASDSFVQRNKTIYAYCLQNSLPRVYTVSNIMAVNRPEEALLVLSEGIKNGVLDLTKTAIVSGLSDFIGEEEPAKQKQQNEIIMSERRNTFVEIDIYAKEKTFLVLTDSYRPQWKAYIDGQTTQLFQTNVIFRGIFVPPGKHIIEFRYEDTPYNIGRLITAITFLIVMVTLFTLAFRRTK